MTTSDCFELGRQSYFNNDYYHTVEWMTEALNRFVIEEGTSNSYNHSQPEGLNKAEILEYLAFSTFKEGECVFLGILGGVGEFCKHVFFVGIQYTCLVMEANTPWFEHVWCDWVLLVGG